MIEAIPRDDEHDDDEDLLAGAMSSPAAMRELLEHVAAMNAGAPNALLPLARLARLGSRGCHWIDGDVRVELVGDHERTALDVYADFGGTYDRLLPTVVFTAPLAEFEGFIASAPAALLPLEPFRMARKVVLVTRTAVPDDKQPTRRPIAGRTP